MYKDLLSKALFTLVCSVLVFTHLNGIAQSGKDSAAVYNHEDPLKVMTYNIRTAKAPDGKNAWNKRRQNVVNVFKTYQPDIIGLQEAEHEQVRFINENLPQYGYVSMGRNDGFYEGAACPVFYKKERFVRVDSKTWWLSPTPDVPGSKGWDAAHPRILTCVILMDTYSGNYLYVFNAQLDHKGIKARIESIKLIKAKIKEFIKDDALILLGDFNLTPDEDSYKMICDPNDKLFDCHTHTLNFVGEEPYTYYGFDISANEGKRLDYVFVNDKFKIIDYEIIVDNDGNYYFSDHLPVIVKLKFW